MRFALVALAALLVATPAAARRPQPHDSPAAQGPTNAPFRAKLVSNATVARRAAVTLASLAKKPAPAKLSAADKKLYLEHSKWLADSAGRIDAVHTRMQSVLAKGEKAPATEVAQMNMEFVNVREALESESRRFADATPAKPRHTTAMNAVRADK